jgi:threonine aldolase
MKMHLDGSRLWEAVAAGAGTIFSYCALFETVSLSFSKGLGAPSGGMLAGSHDAIEKARRIRQSLGGDLQRPEVLSSICLRYSHRSEC